MHMDILKLCIYQSQRQYDKKRLKPLLLHYLAKRGHALNHPKVWYCFRINSKAKVQDVIRRSTSCRKNTGPHMSLI